MGWFNHSHMHAYPQCFQNTRPVTASHLDCLSAGAWQEASKDKERKSTFKGTADIKQFYRIQVRDHLWWRELNSKSVLKAYQYLQLDCVKSSSKLPRAGMTYCTGSQGTGMGGFKHAPWLTRLPERFARLGAQNRIFKCSRMAETLHHFYSQREN